MKIQNNLLAIVALLILGFGNLHAQARFGIKAGLNLANVNYSGEDAADTEILPTFHFGPILDIGFTENIGLGTGMLLHGKGFQLSDEFLGEPITSKFNPLYIQVPVTFNYTKSNFFVSAGPYLAFGVAGTFKTTFGEEKESGKIDFGNDDEADLSPFDFGGALELGYGFGNIRLSASYQLGFSNIFPKDITVDDEKLTNNVIGISAAYLFD